MKKKIVLFTLLFSMLFAIVAHASIKMNVDNGNNAVLYRSTKAQLWGGFSYSYEFIKSINEENEATYFYKISYAERTNHKRLLAKTGTMTIDGKNFTVTKLPQPLNTRVLKSRATGIYIIPNDAVPYLANCNSISFLIPLSGRDYPAVNIHPKNIEEIHLISTLKFEDMEDVRKGKIKPENLDAKKVKEKPSFKERVANIMSE